MKRQGKKYGIRSNHTIRRNPTAKQGQKRGSKRNYFEYYAAGDEATNTFPCKYGYPKLCTHCGERIMCGMIYSPYPNHFSIKKNRDKKYKNNFDDIYLKL